MRSRLPVGWNDRSGVTMAQLTNDKHKEYARYAAHCLDMMAAPSNQESRDIQREMAVEWMRLADDFLRSVGR
jgi:hypothetical protein